MRAEVDSLVPQLEGYVPNEGQGKPMVTSKAIRDLRWIVDQKPACSAHMGGYKTPRKISGHHLCVAGMGDAGSKPELHS